MTYFNLTDQQKGELLKKAGEKSNEMQERLMAQANYKISRDKQWRTILVKVKK